MEPIRMEYEPGDIPAISCVCPTLHYQFNVYRHCSTVGDPRDGGAALMGS